jgi:AcrR family transcriptional regulator
MEAMSIDGRSVRAKNIYDEAHEKLVNSAIELFKNPDVPNENINISLIAKNAGTSVATAYNHFPNNLIDVFGAIFNIGFQKIVDSVTEFNKNNSDPYDQLQAFITIQTDSLIELGNAAREAFYQFREILNSGKWIQGEPYLFLMGICNEYVKKNSDMDATSLANDIFVLWNGYVYLWMRYNPNFEIWSKFTDEWLVQEMTKIIDKAISLQQ